jgi:hypothetical protein
LEFIASLASVGAGCTALSGATASRDLSAVKGAPAWDWCIKAFGRQRVAELQSAGDVGYVSSLMEGVLELPTIHHFVQMIRDAAGRRRAAKLGEKVQRMAIDPSVPTAALAAIGNDLTDLAPGIECPPPRFSEEALALRFSEQYAEDLRYVCRWGHCMRWNGVLRLQDDTLHVFDLARGICRSASSECSDAEKTTAIRLASKVYVRCCRAAGSG